MTGVVIDGEEWNFEQLDKHLKMHFAVVSDSGDDIAKGDDLHALKQQCAGQVKQTFEKAATPELERSDISQWDFESLPETFVQKVGGFEVQAFPALVQKAIQWISHLSMKHKSAGHAQARRECTYQKFDAFSTQLPAK